MTADELERWLERYGRAWVNRDPEAAVELFAPDARYYETPFEPPLLGREGIHRYWQQVPESQEEIHFSAQVLAIASETCLARWQAQFTRVPTGARVELDGVFALEFDRRGLCVVLREWWHRREREPRQRMPE